MRQLNEGACKEPNLRKRHSTANPIKRALSRCYITENSHVHSAAQRERGRVKLGKESSARNAKDQGKFFVSDTCRKTEDGFPDAVVDSTHSRMGKPPTSHGQFNWQRRRLHARRSDHHAVADDILTLAT